MSRPDWSLDSNSARLPIRQVSQEKGVQQHAGTFTDRPVKPPAFPLLSGLSAGTTVFTPRTDVQSESPYINNGVVDKAFFHAGQHGADGPLDPTFLGPRNAAL